MVFVTFVSDLAESAGLNVCFAVKTVCAFEGKFLKTSEKQAREKTLTELQPKVNVSSFAKLLLRRVYNVVRH